MTDSYLKSETAKKASQTLSAAGAGALALLATGGYSSGDSNGEAQKGMRVGEALDMLHHLYIRPTVRPWLVRSLPIAGLTTHERRVLLPYI